MKLFFRNHNIKRRAKIMDDPCLQEIEETAEDIASIPRSVYFQSLFLGGICLILLPFSPIMFFTFKALVFFYIIAIVMSLVIIKIGIDCNSRITEILEASK